MPKATYLDQAEKTRLLEQIRSRAQELASELQNSGFFVAEYTVMSQHGRREVGRVEAARLQTKRALYIGADGEIYLRYRYVRRFMMNRNRPHLRLSEYCLRDQQGLKVLLNRLYI